MNRQKQWGILDKPVRPRGSGLSPDWFHAIFSDEYAANYTITLVRGISVEEAISRLSLRNPRIAPMTFAELDEIPPDEQHRIFTARLDDWTMLAELDGMSGADRLEPMSYGTQAVVCALGHDGESFLGWSADGVALAVYGDDKAFELGEPAGRGEQPDAVVPFTRAIGLGIYRESENADFLPAPVELACLITGVRPRIEHFAGEQLTVVGDW